jgi:hypothetical protein
MEAVRQYVRQRIVEEDRGHGSPCWIWQLSKVHGYGQGKPPGRRQEQAHRFSYRAFVGEIPDGLHLDHLCRVRECCNPEHLEPVTPQENVRRALPFMVWPKKTHCKNGHEFTLENTYYFRNGSRACRKCVRAWQNARADARERSRSPVKNPKTHCAKGHELTPQNTIVWKNARRCRACNIAWRAEKDDHNARQRRYREERRVAARNLGTGGKGTERTATTTNKATSLTHCEEGV